MKSLILCACTLFSCSQMVAQCDTFFGKLVINEVMSSNSSAAADEYGEYDDFVEIYNSTSLPINLAGYFLSDDHGTRTKFVFPDMVINAQDYLIIWCDGQPEQGPLHTSFGISGDREEIGLYDPDTNAVDYVRFQEIPTDITVGRYPNGTGPFARLIPTVGSENVNSVQPGVVINEYMASNTLTAVDQYGAYEDWIELYNNSALPVNLQGYFLSDKIGEPTTYVFPDTVLNPGSYLIVWADQGLMEPGLHTFFKLGIDGDDLIFSDPDTNTIDYVRFGLQYEDVSEGRFPNGTGPFLCPPPSFEASNGGPVSVLQHSTANPMTLYPNPATHTLHIQLPGMQTCSAQVLNISGKVVLKFNIENGTADIPLQHLTDGMYFLQCGPWSQKFIVK